MKVKELIEQLEKMNPDSIVKVWDFERSNYSEIADIYENGADSLYRGDLSESVHIHGRS